jgi:nucleoside-diphosphate-sugar epimerase
MMNVLDGCLRHGVEELYLASSSEVYQTPPRTPTDESAPLVIPDPLNPRFSYGGGKAACELLAINYGRKHFRKVVIYRPHNIYGPDMGWEHVIPQFVRRLHELAGASRTGVLRFPIQGSGREMRSFCFIDDFVAGVMLTQDRGEHLNIYHLGTMDEVSVADLARQIAACVNREIEIVPGDLQAGSTPRRCPEIRKARALGYEPRVPLAEGLRRTVPWYWENMALAERRAEAKGNA